MNRRATIASLFGKQTPEVKQAAPTAPIKTSVAPPPVLLPAGLDPYSGPFDFETAAHLLRRVTFGPTKAQIDQAVADGLEVTMQKVFTNDAIPETELPLNHRYTEDPNCIVGETWWNQPFSLANAEEIRNYRQESIGAWTMGLILEDTISIREKMTLFWHNHFVTSAIEEPHFIYTYSKSLRDNALGNFSDFTKEMIIDPAMLRYLNGNQNVASSPNENFARELLELFTIGKGDLVGPGDYTNYTETDIQEIAKALTGWHDVGYYSIDATRPEGKFKVENHDTSTKVLSNRFGNAQITNAGDEEYSNVVDIILQQPEVSRYIVRKIYRWFIYYDITEEIETSIIEPLAQEFRNSGYEIQPVVETLFRSEHFFSQEAYGCMIKNPMDFAVNMARQFKMEVPADLAKQYFTQLRVGQYAEYLQMAYYNPPNVSGWKAYYQAPSFHQIWLNSVTLPQRIGLAYSLVNEGDDFVENELFIIDPLAFVASLDNPLEVVPMIDEVIKILLPQPLTETQKIFLKATLIPGLPDFEWTVEYSEYAADPTNENLANGIRTRLRSFLTNLLTMAEYQLM